MKILLLAALSTLPLLAEAHDDHDWSADYTAQLSVQYTFPAALGASAEGIEAPKRVDMAFFKEKLAILSGTKSLVARDGKVASIIERKSKKKLDMARDFLADEYAKLGFTVTYQPFSTGSNFIAEKKGIKTPEKVLILSSHIDSVGNRGANDDGTGTIGALAIASELAKKDQGSTLRILGFDREESGLFKKGMVGSAAYVATLDKKEQIIGNINIEMIGTNSRKDGAFHLIDCNKKNSLFLSQAVKDAITARALKLTVVKTCTDRSDHASFWARQIPAIVISENFFGGDGDPCYHQKCDVMDERLNYDYMAEILEATLEASEKLLE